MDASRKTPGRRQPYKGKKPFSNNAQKQQQQQPPPQNPREQAPPPIRVATPPAAFIPQDTPRFADLAKENLLHPILLKTITEDLKFDHMMPVQAATLHELLANRIDCLAQAKTGTGKTIAFLLPAIQTLINRNRGRDRGISLLVISPTRELAMQIAKEATALLQHLPQYKVSYAIGGTNKDREQNSILSGGDILIATPGRLNDHLSEEEVRRQFRHLDTLVLDEADRLLDMGFLNDLKKIINALPSKKDTNRQGMLFSATIPDRVDKVAHFVLGDGYKFISTIPEGEVNTHERVPQHLVVVPEFSDVAPALIGSLKAEMASAQNGTFKAIIFAPTAKLVDFYADILSQIHGMPSVEKLHSRINQNKRGQVTNRFRESTNSILVATDVIARGMDFPLVSHVLQVGVPADKESYIHRLGRTARAGAEGKGIFIITQDETFFSRWTLKDITFHDTPADISSKAQVTAITTKMDTQPATYQAWMGYYKNHLSGLKWDNTRLVQEANKFAHEGLGSPEVPGIERKTIGKMGLKGVKGLNIVAGEPGSNKRVQQQQQGGRPSKKSQQEASGSGGQERNQNGGGSGQGWGQMPARSGKGPRRGKQLNERSDPW